MNNNTSQDCNFFFYQKITVNISKISWVEDYVFIQFCHNYDNCIIELWESKNDAAFTHVDTDNLGNNNFRYKTWQNANMSFKIRAIINGVAQQFSEPVNIKTPLTFMYDQAILSTMVFDYIWLDVGKTVHIDWGDGTSLNVRGVDFGYKAIQKNYPVTGQYRVTITGDTDNIRYFFFELVPDSSVKMYDDLSKWVLPNSLEVIEISNAKVGTISNTNIEGWFPLPPNIEILNINSIGALGNLNNVPWPTKMREIFINGSRYTGNPFLNGLPTLQSGSISIMANSCAFSGDLSTVQLPPKLWKFYISNQTSVNKFFGDLSGIDIPTGDLVVHSPAVIGTEIGCQKNNFTKGYRGHFKWVYIYDFRENIFDAAEIEDILHYIDNYFSGGVVPMVNCTYNLSGVGMAVANAAALVYKANIEAKYITAGFVATIIVN